MDWTVAEGGTYEEAVASLLKSLGADKSEIEVEDLGEQRKMFGFGGVVMRVRGRFRVESFRDEPAQKAKPAPRHSQQHPARAASPRTQKQSQPPQQAQAVKEDASASQVAEMEEKGCAFLEEIVRAMGVDGATVTASSSGSTITLNIESSAGGLIIGRSGETLEALQTLMEIYASRLNEGRTRLVVDTENYRLRREEKLKETALKAAEEVIAKGKKVYMGYMKSSERKMVHTVLQGNDKVETKSQGAGENRQIVIYPARHGGSSGK